MSMDLMTDPNKITIHCAATSDSPSAPEITVEDIRVWHTIRGFSDVGYHWVITRRGIIQEGRDIKYQGAHVLHHNENYIGICLVGTRDFTPQQVDGLILLYQTLYDRYAIKPNEVFGHSDFPEHKTRECPNISMAFVRKLLSLAT